LLSPLSLPWRRHKQRAFPDILGHGVLPERRLALLGVTPDLQHGLFAVTLKGEALDLWCGIGEGGLGAAKKNAPCGYEGSPGCLASLGQVGAMLHYAS
jgi:hypothetical protein